MDTPRKLEKPARALPTSGFPSPADGYAEASLDVCDLLAPHPAATFYLRMRSAAHARAGVYPGDILVVDRSLPPTPGRLVVIALDGTLRVMRWRPCQRARSEDAGEGEASEGILWGVVTYVIHTADALPQ